MQQDAVPEILRCPACRGRFSQEGNKKTCSACLREYHCKNGFWDFTSAGSRFTDWWASNPEDVENFHTMIAPQEEEGQKHFASSYIQPLLHSLFGRYNREKIRVLSVGCGVGMDVDRLNELGFEAWGVEAGHPTSAVESPKV